MAQLSLAFDILARDRASAQIDHVAASMGRAAKAGAFFGTVAGNVATKGIELLGNGARSAVGQLSDVVGKASDLSESLSKTRVVFGQASASVEEFAKTAASSLGVSQQEALEATSTFGNLFRALGIGTKPAADLSTQVVKLAGDLASFNNANPAEVLDALKSGLLGEAEPLRRFGVTLSAARVQAEALADGLVAPVKDSGKVRSALVSVEVATSRLAKAQKDHGSQSIEAVKAADGLAKANTALSAATKGTVPQLTAAQRAQASYNIIMKDTKTAQGDFTRTSGGLANQQRILAARITDVKAQIGTALLPVMTRFANYLNSSVVPGLSGFITQMTTGTGRGGEFAAKMRDLLEVGRGLVGAVLPFFQFLASHPDLFTSVAVGAAALATAFKVQAAYGLLVSRFMPGLAVATAAEGTAAAGAATSTLAFGGALRGVAGAAALIGPAFVNAKVPIDNFKKLIDDPKIQKYLNFDPNSQDSINRRNKAQETGPAVQPADGGRVGGHRQVDDNGKVESAASVAARQSADTKAGRVAAKHVAAGVKAGAKDIITEMSHAGTDAAQALVDAISTRFEAAKSRLQSLVSASLSLRQSVTSALQQGTSLADVFSGDDLNANGAFGKQNNFGRVQAFLQKRVAMLRKFVVELRTLMKRGLDPSLVAQIAQAGVDGGHRIAEAILSGGSGAVGTVNGLERQIASLANTTGKSVADDHFAKQIAEQRHTTEVLGHKLDVANSHLAKLNGTSKTGSVTSSLVTTGSLTGI